MKSNRDMFRDDDLFAPIGQHPADHVRTDPVDETAQDQRVPLSIIDKYFDADLKPEESKALFEKLRSRPDRAKEAVWTQRAIDALCKPVTTPDFTRSVLRAVGDRRAWLPRRDRFAVWGLRYAAVLVLVGMTAAAFTLQRVAPEATALTPRVTPVSDVVDAVSQSTERAAATLPDSFARFQSSVFFDQSQLSYASFTPATQAPARFTETDDNEPSLARRRCVSAVGLQYTDDQTTLCDTAPQSPRADNRTVVIRISNSKK